MSKEESFIRELISIGEGKRILEEVLDLEIFENLSKHNPWWDSDPENEKFDALRCKLSFIKERLWDAWGKI